jgi:hypothetical protein
VQQCVRTYVRAATGAVAQGVQAAGIDVALPRNVGILVAVVEDVCAHGGLSQGFVHQYIPPFITDTWLSVLQ